MAHGKNGKLTIGANAVVAQVTQWNRAQKGDMAETGHMGGGDDKVYEPGRRDTTYDVQGNYDPTDTDGQEVIEALAPVTFKLYPEGDSSGKKYFAGSGFISQLGHSAPLDGKITFSFTIQQSGPGTRPTVTP